MIPLFSMPTSSAAHVTGLRNLPRDVLETGVLNRLSLVERAAIAPAFKNSYTRVGRLPPSHALVDQAIHALRSKNTKVTIDFQVILHVDDYTPWETRYSVVLARTEENRYTITSKLTSLKHALPDTKEYLLRKSQNLAGHERTPSMHSVFVQAAEHFLDQLAFAEAALRSFRTGQNMDMAAHARLHDQTPKKRAEFDRLFYPTVDRHDTAPKSVFSVDELVMEIRVSSTKKGRDRALAQPLSVEITPSRRHDATNAGLASSLNAAMVKGTQYLLWASNL